MKVCFTGTRKGMTIAQWAMVQTELQDRFKTDGPHEFHGGDAIGADHQTLESVKMLKKMFGWEIETHGHPCNIPSQRAFDEFDVMNKVFPPLVRNRHMVLETELTIAGPFEYDEIVRGSGTWATMRYAATHRQLLIVWPDGSTEFKGEKKGLF